MMATNKVTFLTIISLQFIITSYASEGDQSYYFDKCLNYCDETVCKNDTRVMEMKAKQPLALRLTFWNCEDECKYHCMWATVKKFLKDKNYVPQFYGKWPFIRFCGAQEPASAFFSVLNGLSFYFMWKKFRRKVQHFAPTYYIWNGYALVNMNAWLWSTVFHTRDTPITEMLDYFSATSGILYSCFGLCARLLYRKSRLWLATCGILCLLLFIKHVHFLAFVHFDYGYNMKATVAVGVINSIGWLLFCAVHWREMPHVKKCLTVVLCVNTFLLLELCDFPPFFWIFDAHSLWHLLTIPLPWLWFNFLIEDCSILLKELKIP